MAWCTGEGQREPSPLVQAVGSCTVCRGFYFFLINFLKINLFHLFIFGCWVFVAVHGLSLVVASGGYSLLRGAGFSLWWLLLLWSTGSRCTGFSSCGLRAQ